MKKIIALSLLFTSLLIVKASGQKQANNWYFGTGAGISFASGSPVGVTNCSPSFNAFEGVGAMSDAAGNLLFYSDGNTVFNANHVAMPNGSGLLSNTSSTQTALIIKQPGNTNLYYIFTNDLATFYYSVIDMNLQGGLGDVTATKNVLLRNNVTERGTMVRHANGVDFWVITHDTGNDAFAAFQVTAAGISLPVVSNTGLNVTSTIGAMKVSPTADKIGVAGFYDNRYELHDFDNATGIVSNSNASPANYVYAYGCEFSPDGTKLYGGKENSQDLWQFDLNAGANVWNTATLITQTVAIEFEQLQLGPDGKIYCSLYQFGYLGVVNDPNQPGLACNYSDSGVYLMGKTCYLGLPQFEPTLFNSGFEYEPVCFGDSVQFSIPYQTGLFGVVWNFDDPNSGINNSSTLFDPAHLYTAPGGYLVQLITFSAQGTDTISDSVYVYSVPTPNLGPDTVICVNQNLVLDAGSGLNQTYLWNTGDTVQSITVTTDGTYSVFVSNGVCTATDSVLVSTIICQPVINLSSSDTTFCEKQCIDFFDLSTGSPTSWLWLFPGAVPDTSVLQNPANICYNNYGTFDVTLIACNPNGCDTLVMTGFITELPNPVDTIWQSNDTLYSQPAQTYQWFEVTSGIITGATNSYYVITQPGNYYCVVTDSVACVATSNIIIVAGLNELTGKGSMFIMPNPNNGMFTIDLSGIAFNSASLNIFDVQGRLVMKHELTESVSKLDTRLGNGLYMAALEINDKTYYQRLIIKN